MNGQLTHVEYIAENSKNEILEALRREGISVRLIGGSLEDLPVGEKHECALGRAHVWLSFLWDSQLSGYMFMFAGDYPFWPSWFTRRELYFRFDEELNRVLDAFTISAADVPSIPRRE